MFAASFFWSRSRIQLIQSGFKLIKFGDNKIRQARKLVGYEDVVTNQSNIPFDKDNNRLPFKNNVEYTQARFMQASKMMKKSMIIFFTNSNLAYMREYFSYKNLKKMKVLLIELPYIKVI